MTRFTFFFILRKMACLMVILSGLAFSCLRGVFLRVIVVRCAAINPFHLFFIRYIDWNSILSQGNEIFQTLSTEEYNDVIQLLEQAILATDLALYFKYVLSVCSLHSTVSFHVKELQRKKERANETVWKQTVQIIWSHKNILITPKLCCYNAHQTLIITWCILFPGTLNSTEKVYELRIGL